MVLINTTPNVLHNQYLYIYLIYMYSYTGVEYKQETADGLTTINPKQTTYKASSLTLDYCLTT